MPILSLRLVSPNSTECKVGSQFFCPDDRRRVCRRCRGTSDDACGVERDRFGGGSIMVWEGISHGVKSQLIVIAGNITAVK